MERKTIGHNIHKSAYIHPSVVIGKNVKIGPQCSIGYEGFLFSRDKDGIPQFKEHRGGVVIEDGVEIQAGVAIARGVGKDDNTTIHRNTKIDNLVHIAHNCEIGERNLLAAGVIFGGYIKTGRDNFFGLNCVILPCCVMGDCNLIGMGAVVTKRVPDHEIWAGNPARKLRDNLMFKKNNAT